MRKSLILVLLCFSLTISGATYYVSPGGSDSYPGTVSQPWKSLNYAFNKLAAGDILYVRGGTYTTMGRNNRGISINNHNGTSSSPIKVLAYSGETPVFDCSGLSASSGDVIGLEISNCSYWTIEGLDIKNVPEPTSHDGPGPGCAISGCSNITFDQVNVHDCGNGFITYVSDYIYYKNCDSYQNADALNSGDLANGFYTRVTKGQHVFYDGCRAWLNSDDGWDAFCFNGAGDGFINYNKCWSFENGAWGGYVGNGCGFKTGVTSVTAIGGVQRTLTNCLAFNNSGAGYDESQDLSYGYSIPHVIYNCVSYNNVVGFDFDAQAGNLGSFNADIIKNCISYKDGRTSWKNFPNNILSNNWFQPGGFDNYFASLDASQAKGNRQADGSLPVMTFLHLTTSSTPLIDAGADVGIAYAGKGTDIGAFEMQTGSTTTIPVYTSSVVENAAPLLIQMTYSLSLTSVVPANSAFNVKVNSVARTVNSVSISGNTVQLTLASAIKFGDIVTVSYTKPATNPIQTTTGETATGITNQPVINNIINPAKDALPGVITMLITPNHIHRIINVVLQYSDTFSVQDPVMSPQIIRIVDLSGKLYIEKLLVTGISNIRIPINLRTGIYNVLIVSGGIQMTSQKIVVY